MYYSKDLMLTVVDEESAKALYAQYNDYKGRANCDPAHSFVVPETYTKFYEDISGGGLGFIVKKRDGTVIGYGSLGIDYVPRVARPYLFLGKQHRGQGYGTQLMAVLLHIAFQEVNARKVSLVVYASNRTGRHLYEKMGFKLEGKRIDEVYREGDYWDVLYMGMFKDDWRELWKTYVTNEEGKALYITEKGDGYPTALPPQETRAMPRDSEDERRIAQLVAATPTQLKEHAQRLDDPVYPHNPQGQGITKATGKWQIIVDVRGMTDPTTKSMEAAKKATENAIIDALSGYNQFVDKVTVNQEGGTKK